MATPPRTITPLTLTHLQYAFNVLRPSRSMVIGGRASSKTNLIAQLIHRMRLMPGSTVSLTSASYKFIMTNILPAVMGMMERMGYHRDLQYMFGSRPTWANQKPTYSQPFNYEHFFSFMDTITADPKYARQFGVQLVSQDRGGVSGRGPSFDFEIVDEIQSIDLERYNKTVHPGNRGNLDKFSKDCYWHHGYHMSGSMPYDQKRDQLLAYASYYRTEYGVDYLRIWKQITEKQLQLLQISHTEYPEEFKQLWNQIQKLKRLIHPRKRSEDGLVFMLSNVFDNQYVGYEYILEQWRSTPTPLLFYVEVLNMIMDQVEDNYYFLDDRHEYTDAVNYEYLDSLGLDYASAPQNCLSDSDTDPALPLILGFDWGGKFAGMHVIQHTRKWEQAPNSNQRYAQNYLKWINEFFIKPPDQMVPHLINPFLKYYKPHKNKRIIFIEDKHGNLRRLSKKTWNQEAIDLLKADGWKVEIRSHKGQEPSHFDAYKLQNTVLRELNPQKYPKYRFNADRCKNTLVALKNTSVKEVDDKLQKVKTSENNKNIAQEHATHFTDIVGKVTETYTRTLQKQSAHGHHAPTH